MEQDTVRMEIPGGFIEVPRELIEFLCLVDKPFKWLREHGFELAQSEEIQEEAA